MPILEFRPPEERDQLPADKWFNAQVVSISVKDKQTKDGEKYQQLGWKFTVIDPGGTYDGVTAWGDTGAKPVAAADCKVWTWAQGGGAASWPGHAATGTVGRRLGRPIPDAGASLAPGRLVDLRGGSLQVSKSFG